MTNAFNWQGKPSIFTTNAKQQPFGVGHASMVLAQTLRQKKQTLMLDGSSTHQPPQMMKRRSK